jgi:hypothetical protein
LDTNIANIEIGLRKYGKVYLPKIGLFSIYRESASPNWDKLSLNPPFENIVFIPERELFSTSNLNIKIPEICRFKSELLLSELIGQREMDVPELGRLFIDNEQLIQFTPFESNSINAYFNELKPVSFEFVDQDKPAGSIIEPVRHKSPKKYSKWLLLLLIFPMLLIYFYSTRSSDIPLEKIPNGKVNIKPEMTQNDGITLFPDSNISADPKMDDLLPNNTKEPDTADGNWNAKKAEPETPVKVEATDPCYVIVGSFLNHRNSNQLKLKLQAEGYQVQLFPYQSYMRVGIHMDCIDSVSTLSEIKRKVHKDAWIFN